MSSLFEAEFNTRVMPAVERAFAVDVQFQRGDDTSDSFKARRDDIDGVAMGQELGINAKVTKRDYWLPVSSVVINSTPVQPRSGDKIIEGDTTWEVYFPDDSTPASEPVPGGYDWLTHVRLVT